MMKQHKRISRERAIELALMKNHKILYTGWSKETGRKFFVIDSYSKPGKKHVVRHTPYGFACEAEKCEGYKQSGGCSHIGAVYIFITTLSQETRLEYLRPHPIEERQAVVRVEELPMMVVEPPLEERQIAVNDYNWQKRAMTLYGRR